MVAKIVLSTLASDATIVDGMLGTMVITTEAVGARTIVLPLGQSVAHHDVTRGTYVLAFAAMDTHIGIHRKLLVGNHAGIKIGANDMTERPRGQASRGLDDA